jgi:hypothetical protein
VTRRPRARCGGPLVDPATVRGRIGPRGRPRRPPSRRWSGSRRVARPSRSSTSPPTSRRTARDLPAGPRRGRHGGARGRPPAGGRRHRGSGRDPRRAGGGRMTHVAWNGSRRGAAAGAVRLDPSVTAARGADTAAAVRGTPGAMRRRAGVMLPDDDHLVGVLVGERRHRGRPGSSSPGDGSTGSGPAARVRRGLAVVARDRGRRRRQRARPPRRHDRRATRPLPILEPARRSSPPGRRPGRGALGGERRVLGWLQAQARDRARSCSTVRGPASTRGAAVGAPSRRRWRMPASASWSVRAGRGAGGSPAADGRPPSGQRTRVTPPTSLVDLSTPHTGPRPRASGRPRRTAVHRRTAALVVLVAAFCLALPTAALAAGATLRGPSDGVVTGPTSLDLRVTASRSRPSARIDVDPPPRGRASRRQPSLRAVRGAPGLPERLA